MNIGTSENICEAVLGVLTDLDILFTNLVSCIMDICAAMPRVKSGVEKFLREKQLSFLDIAGDAVHVVDNAAKALIGPFEDYCENHCGEFYY